MLNIYEIAYAMNKKYSDIKSKLKLEVKKAPDNCELP
jgi:hypothetical protein